MSAKTTIEWTDASWNPIVGCTEVSPGCANCYAARLAATRLRNSSGYKGLTTPPAYHCAEVDPTTNQKPRWTGEVRFLPERLEEPLHWKKPRRIFVCDMGDLFHEDVSGEIVGKVFDVMQRCPQHTFQVLTKRAHVMMAWIRNYPNEKQEVWPLPNVWLGVSVENQHFADERHSAAARNACCCSFHFRRTVAWTLEFVSGSRSI